MTFSRFVIVIGLSGAGKSQVMKSFEDLGFYCLDNLPPALVPELVSLAERAELARIALSLDMRVHGPFGEALGALAALEARGVPFEVLYLDANDEALVRRYSETRRRHPCGASGNLRDAIAAERRELAPFRSLASEVWDTSQLTQSTLKARIVAAFDAEVPAHRLAANVVAFGFKYGVPLDADLLFDVRFFPNPNYVPELKELTGADAPVAAFMEALPETEQFLARLFDLLDFLIPRYSAEGKSRLTIAIGCTGGRHRSPYIAGRLAAHLRKRDDVVVAREDRELSSARA
ncbi:MAG: RNase adapter RapZ [Candidatus Eremiobacteraeota bacterium]|nr:RNase adapter RapZ [Candidatus Eremiobacteraeota bacterium]